MSRWSPWVRPEVPELASAEGIGDALAQVGELRRANADRRYARSRDALADARYDASVATEQARHDDAMKRQAVLDERATREGAVRAQGDELSNRGRARDLGYVDDQTFAGRRTAASALSQGGRAMAGAAPSAAPVAMLGDALLSAMDRESPSMDLMTASGGRDTLRYDPTQTKEARDESERIRLEGRQRADADRVRAETHANQRGMETFRTDENIRQYSAQRAIDDRYARDKETRDRAAGGGGRGGATPNLSVANSRVDDARTRLQTIERQEPRAPDFTKFRGGSAPLPGDPDYAEFQADSTQRATRFAADSMAHAGRLGDATKSFERWNSIADSLAHEVMGLSGGESVQGSQQVQAAAEQQRLLREFNARLAELQGDPEALREMKQRYAELSQAINEKYGLSRRRPEE